MSSGSLPKFFLVLTLMAVLLTVACAAPAPTPSASSPAPSPAAASSQAAKPSPSASASQPAKPSPSPAVSAPAKAEVSAAILEGAKKEGKLHVMHTSRVEESKAWLDPFQKAYPFITELEYTRIRLEDEYEAQLTAMKAGQPPPADVLSTRAEILSLYEGVTFLEDLRPLLLPMGVSPSFITPGGLWAFTGGVPQGSAYNRDNVKPADVPKTWEEMVDPKWKGRISIDTSPQAFMGLVHAWGEQKTLDWLTQLMKNEPTLVRGQTQRLDMLTAGEQDVTIGVGVMNILEHKARSQPLEPIVMQPIPVENSYLLGAAKGSKNPNAAKLFLAWLLSKAGQKALYEARPPQGLPGYGWIESHPLFIGAKWSVIPVEITLKQGEYYAKFRKIMGLPGS